MATQGSTNNHKIRAWKLSATLDGGALSSTVFVGGIGERSLLESTVKRQNQFMELLFHLSASFINISLDEVPAMVRLALQKIAEYTEADRVYVCKYDFADATASIAFEYCAPGIVPRLEFLQDIPFDEIPDWIDAHNQGELLYKPRLNEVWHGKLRDILAPEKTKSLLTLPLMLPETGECIGCIGFDAFSPQSLYGASDLRLLGLFGQMLVNTEERRRTDEKLALAGNIFSHTREGIVITTTDGTITDVNDAFCHITGYSREEALGQKPSLLKSELQGPEFYEQMWGALGQNGYWQGELWNRRKDGEIYAERLTISAINRPSDGSRLYVGLFTDITTQKLQQRQLERMAHYDALTGLPNRLLLADRLHQAISAAKRQGDSLAVVYIDLDGFKAVNDNHGHDVGDQLLKKVSSRMRAALRENDTLARLGGDEFVAVLSDLNSEETCHAILSRMLAAAAKPVQIHQTCEVQVSASLGVSLFPQAEVTEADQLLRQADHAMYQAKITGKNRYHFFDKEEDKTLKGRYDSLQNIRKALEAREFILLYQPKVNLRLREVVGFEALIRWQHPEAGLLPPSAFLPMVENDPLSIDLGDWAIGEALAQMEAWQAFGIALPVSVNISALQLQQQDFVERLQQRLADHPNVKPEQLELEILETSALEDISHASSVMTACQKIGVGFALDDFGTGYSSLNYLKNLPAKQLKIDQSFIRNMLDDAGDLAITQGVIGLASAFRRQVIAEGMETAEHAELLLCLGCEQAQGYAISHPMKADQIPNWLAAWRLSPARSRLPQVATEDLPLLLAIVRFRSWYRSLETSLEDELPELALNILESPLGDWFAQQSGSPNKHLPSLQEGKYAYAKIHGLAESLLVERELDHERRVRELLLEIREHSKRLLQLLLACKQQLSEEASEA